MICSHTSSNLSIHLRHLGFDLEESVIECDDVLCATFLAVIGLWSVFTLKGN